MAYLQHNWSMRALGYDPTSPTLPIRSRQARARCAPWRSAFSTWNSKHARCESNSTGSPSAWHQQQARCSDSDPTLSVSALLVTIGDNPGRLRSEAAFAHLCGVAPIPASSGKTNRHRLHRGGDRSGNSALHIATIVRLRYDPRSRAYADRRTTEGLSMPEIIRCQKRYLAREVFHALRADYTK